MCARTFQHMPFATNISSEPNSNPREKVCRPQLVDEELARLRDSN